MCQNRETCLLSLVIIFKYTLYILQKWDHLSVYTRIFIEISQFLVNLGQDSLSACSNTGPSVQPLKSLGSSHIKATELKAEFQFKIKLDSKILCLNVVIKSVKTS